MNGKKELAANTVKREAKKRKIYTDLFISCSMIHTFLTKAVEEKNHHTILYLHIERASRPMLERCLVRLNVRETECKCAKAWP